MSPSSPLLFTPLTIRDVTARNRVAISPMCQYSADYGLATEWHRLHLPNFARGGAGIVFTEATAVEPVGRITHGDLGIWSDTHAEALKPIVAEIARYGAVPGLQVAHAGRKGSTQRPWEGNGLLTDADTKRGDAPWQVVGPTAEALQPSWPSVRALTVSEIKVLCESFASAARRALAAGFEVIEVHAAHGYLLHTFMSPLTNTRNDEYGGDRTGRMRFMLEVAEAIRSEWPQDKALFVRLSVIDNHPNGWQLEDSILLAEQLKACGVDVIDCSSGGFAGAPVWRLIDQAGNAASQPQPLPKRAPGFQVPLAAEIKRKAGILTQTVGFITEAKQAEKILQDGDADLIAIGRAALYDPFWANHAAQELGADSRYKLWPEQYAWWLRNRRKA
jgi:2,4-dienoyl-CoA reductase-like NADH-dependent reductase (Old Yellow Enzyme family)